MQSTPTTSTEINDLQGSTLVDNHFQLENGESNGNEVYLKGFKVEGIAQKGRVKLKLDAPNEIVLRNWLDEAHIEPVEIKKQLGKVSARKKIGKQDIANFVGQLADRKSAGQGDIEAIKSCADSTENAGLKRALTAIVERMESGVSPEKAFEASKIYNFRKKQYTDKPTFPKELIHTIKAGKRGNAVKLLRDYEARLNESVENRNEFISEMIFPLITIVLAVILSNVMIFVVIPQFKMLYQGFASGDAQLPLLTRIVIGFNEFSTSPLGLIIIAATVAVISYSIHWLYATEAGRIWRQKRELYLPQLGYGAFSIRLDSISNLLVAYHGSFHLTSLGQIMKSTDLVTALKEVAEGASHVEYKTLFANVAATIENRGGSFAKTGRPYTYLLNRDFYSMMETGSQGDMSEQVLKLADQMQAEFKTRLKRLMKLITPVTACSLGVIIGGVIIAMYLPMIDIINKLSSSGK